MDMMNVLTYLCPTKIYMGINAHEKLKEIIAEQKVKRLLLMCDPGVVSGGIYRSIENVLKDHQVTFEVFAEIEPDPSTKTVEKAYEICRTMRPSILLALGGGSTMDAAKAAGILVTNGGRIQDYEGNDKFKNPPLPLIAIPTTAGTGSEVSYTCVITDTERATKMGIRSAALNRAQMAILDPVALRSLPEKAAAHAAMDAFVHALESYISLQANPITDAVNLHAMELIAQNVRSFVFNRNHMQAGLRMLCAAALAGMGFSNTGLGNIHCMARLVGAFFHVPHGLSNAVCLPYVAEFNLMANPEKFARVALAMGEKIQGLTVLEAGRKAMEAIKQLNKDWGIPMKLREVGVTEDRLPEMARLAFESNYNRWNPRYTTIEDFRSLFEKAF
jgi:alcohol dehydrogenase